MKNLKSNMDRFIVYKSYSAKLAKRDLKSNMDRFIVPAQSKHSVQVEYLKSNMDRFIEEVFQNYQNHTLI